MSDTDKDDIRNRVSVVVPGKHGMIGFIVPERRPTREELIELYRGLILIELASKRKVATEA